MKLVVLDHADWVMLNRQNKVSNSVNFNNSIVLMRSHPATKNWRPAISFFSTLIPLAIVGSVILIFAFWWLGLLLLFLSAVPLRKAYKTEIMREVLLSSEANPNFYTQALEIGALFTSVKEEDLVGIAYIDKSVFRY
ncbi:MAG: hypothetical protein GX811_09095 [Lentisphaerae bacterium]|nr:hypothetical protein [Lentisphaerota bacterium]